jgi:CheY-like chemotaxis protein
MKSQHKSVGSSGSTEADQSVKSAGHRLLVVDDDSSVRETLTRVLVDEGYLVWAGENATLEFSSSSQAGLDPVNHENKI